jgi:hypothetical protein
MAFSAAIFHATLLHALWKASLVSSIFIFSSEDAVTSNSSFARARSLTLRSSNLAANRLAVSDKIRICLTARAPISFN